MIALISSYDKTIKQKQDRTQEMPNRRPPSIRLSHSSTSNSNIKQNGHEKHGPAPDSNQEESKEQKSPKA